jgi:hypothetical protein
LLDLGEAFALEASGDDGDFDLVAERVVGDEAEVDLDIGVAGGVADQLTGFVHGAERELAGGGEVEQDGLGALEAAFFEQRAFDGGAGGVAGGIGPPAVAVPMMAKPMPSMMARTSAKSRLISPGVVMMSLMP